MTLETDPSATVVFRGQRYTVKGLTKQDRERRLQRRICRVLRRHGFAIEDLAELDARGIRTNGESFAASLGGFRLAFAVVLPGRVPDQRQRVAMRLGVIAAYSASDAIRALSLGCLTIGRD